MYPQYYETVDHESLSKLHEAALQMLEKQGVRIHDEKMVQALKNSGAICRSNKDVLLPSAMVEKAISFAPSRFDIYDRAGGRFSVGTSAHMHLNGGTVTDILEYPGLTVRKAVKKDVADLSRLVDAADSIGGCVVPVIPSDVKDEEAEMIACAETLKNTTKFVLACPADFRATEAFTDMAKATMKANTLASKPVVCLLASTLPGYEIDHDSACTVRLAAKEGLPIVLMGGTIMGAQSPASMAGSFVMKLAQNLALLTALQVLHPHNPCLMNWGSIKLDMRTMEIEEAGPEYFITMGAGAGWCRRYGIPSYSCPSADAKWPDFQAGYEMTMGLSQAIACGIHVSVNAGTAAKASALSYELMLCHNEMLRTILRVSRGLHVNDETMAVALQQEIGIRGEYLTVEHTRKLCHDRREFLHKDLFDATGIRHMRRDPMDRARTRVKQMLEQHKAAVSDEQKHAVDTALYKAICRM